jgi:hypothetical protein
MVYTPAVGTISESNPGTLVIRRTIVNCYGEPATGACVNAEPGTAEQTITQLEVLVTGSTTYGDAGSGQALLRAVSSTAEPAPVVTTAGPVTVVASTLNAPSASNGGYVLAYNALDDLEPYTGPASSPPTASPPAATPAPTSLTGAVTPTTVTTAGGSRPVATNHRAAAKKAKRRRKRVVVCSRRRVRHRLVLRCVTKTKTKTKSKSKSKVKVKTRSTGKKPHKPSSSATTPGARTTHRSSSTAAVSEDGRS